MILLLLQLLGNLPLSLVQGRQGRETQKCFNLHQQRTIIQNLGTSSEPSWGLLDLMPYGTLPGCACCAEPPPEPEPHEPTLGVTVRNLA